jgi:hypothetical protein
LVLSAKIGTTAVQGQFSITIAPADQPLTAALGSIAPSPQTGPAAPWKGVSKTLADGSTGIVAESGQISNNGLSWLRFNCGTANSKAGSRWSVLSFYWKVSSEAGADFLICTVDGIMQRDADTGKRLAISGDTGWIKQTLWIDTNSQHVVEFNYIKDPSLSSGEDRAWVYGLSLGALPVITTAPADSIKITPGSSADSKTFSLDATVDNATSLVWKRDGVTLKDGASSTGSIVSGSATGNLKLTNVSASDAGVYWIEATNGFGTVANRGTVVTVVAPPVFTSLPVVPAGLKLGDPLTLNVSASGAQPMLYRWNKDGVTGRWSSSPSLTIPRTTSNSPGQYSITAVNPFGAITSGSIKVSFGAAAQSMPSK